MYQEYGCNKGELIFIMDGINVYHDKLVAKYRDSLGGVFPMLAINDNMDSLHFIKKDFPGAAPTYALISPSKEILYSGRSKTEFLAAVEELNLTKNPQLCDTMVDNSLPDIKTGMTKPIEISRSSNNRIRLQVNSSGLYNVKIFSINGKCVKEINLKRYDKGSHEININTGRGVYLFKIFNDNENLIINRSLQF